MSFQEPHEMHKRRFGRNLGVGLTLAAFIAIVFALTIVKINNGGTIEGFDHAARPGLVPAEGTGGGE